MALAKYIGRKVAWTLVVFIVALLLNFLLPRLIPGNPVDAIVGRLAMGGGTGGEQLQQVHEHYMAEFGLDKPLWQQFFIYIGKVFQGDLGTSFAQLPGIGRLLDRGRRCPGVSRSCFRPSSSVGLSATCSAHWRRSRAAGWTGAPSSDRCSSPAFRRSRWPSFCCSWSAAKGGILPVGGAYSFGLTPEFSLAFFGDAITYWWLPFWSLVLVFIGGQAVGMRSMAIYELGSDYVNYNRGLGVKEGHTVRYIFRNAMLPQFTGLALSIAAIITGGLITELVFSYPGLGSLLFAAIGQNDYPVISAITLLITIAVLIFNLAADVLTGVIDPRIRAAETGER